MPKHEDETPVIFRKYGDGEVIALFPSLPGGEYGLCQSYLHVGQHGAANCGHVIRTTKATVPAEYADLQVELVQIGYGDLKVYHREQPWMHRTRCDYFLPQVPQTKSDGHPPTTPQ